MPHINRIRVNNVKYNFGTQFYDDFMMRFSGKNTIYDLANGGGKSVLMLLLLQNLIPNCTLDEKQPVEKLFRTSSGSNTIHSLVEWKLDPCYQRDNFKYMTTGFCARKGRDNPEESNRESASIEYFNYCIFYREFGDNDIKNLPLSKDGERVTYNGLKSYLRDLEKKDHGVEAYIFERKGDYQNFISQYGLFESEWEIIRGINKTEGHVRTYFENNYKTGRKVVEDLLIEEIIQKSFNNQIGNRVEDADAEDNGMARTLLDIKDRIVELSRRKEEINIFDHQIALMEELSEKILTFKDYQAEKDDLKNQLLDKLALCRKVLENMEEELAKAEECKNTLEDDYKREDRQIAIAKIIDDEKELVNLQALVKEFAEKIQTLVEQENDINDQIRLVECINSYRDLKKYEGLKQEVVLAMDNRMREHGDIYEEIRSIAARAHELLEPQIARYEKQLQELSEKVHESQEDYDRLRRVKEELEIKSAVSQGTVGSLAERIRQCEEKLAVSLKESPVLVPEQLPEAIEKTRTKEQELQETVEKDRAQEESLRNRLEEERHALNEAQADLRVLQYEESGLQKESGLTQRDKDKIQALVNVYGEMSVDRLSLNIYNRYKNSIREIAEKELSIHSMQEYVNNLSQGRYMLDGEQYQKVENYLYDTYGEDVMHGYEWYGTLTDSQRRDVSRRIPFLDYSFVIKGDFDRVKEDVNLRNFSHSSYIVPIISEMILRDTRHAASADYIVFGTKDLSFLTDPGKVAAELDSMQSELYTAEEELKRLKRSQDVLWEDYLFTLDITGREKQSAGVNLEDVQERINAQQELMAQMRTKEEHTREELQRIREQREDHQKALERIGKDLEVLENADGQWRELEGLRRQHKELVEELKKEKVLCEEYRASFVKCGDALQDETARRAKVQEQLECTRTQWKEVFESYYTEGQKALEEELDYEELVVRMKGLLEVVHHETSDVMDKKTLIAAYDDSISKYMREITKRGYSLQEIEERLKEPVAEDAGILQQRLRSIREEMSRLRSENEAQNAQMNRMDGALFHARSMIREKYGEFELFECDNTRQFIAEHTVLCKEIGARISELDRKLRNQQKILGNLTVIDRDLERMLENSGVHVPEEMPYAGAADIEKLQGYEEIQKRFDKLLRNEYRKREEFAREKRRIMDQLKDCKAFDLAEEIDRSVEVPDSVAQIEEMAKNIKDTCECILLERERVEKGIEDMERIKENFESRCIQTCTNIKAELDRLPKLSKITLDDEVISMIGLNIPYVKEEFYKERMSNYINETVLLSESFKTDEERIQYIKGRLAWKKLFSVIVTDMNQIRLNLYKRERIKDQSKYLRYEEAVGSTGQSQGIYIQFLIAIINYISNINAAGKEASAIGKVVFIDNPFGAAKDIYIWEPIFKLLKTNHVQLIVPARGVTPAITGKFDVNYILGQKLVNGRQQTVVVDYRSQVPQDVMEYTKLEYSQESLF